MTGTAAGALSSLWTGSYLRGIRARARCQMPKNRSAFEHRVLAVDLAMRFSAADCRAALEHCLQATTIQPDHARAWSTMATVRHLLTNIDDTAASRQAHAGPHREAALRAAALAPDDPVGLFQSAFVSAQEGRTDDAMTTVHGAVSLQPNNPDVLSRALVWSGFWRPFERHARLWRERMVTTLSTYGTIHRHALGAAAFQLREYAEALRLYRRFPVPPFNALWMVSAAVRLGNAPDIVAARELYRDSVPGDLTVSELLDADGTFHPDARMPLLENAARAGLPT